MSGKFEDFNLNAGRLVKSEGFRLFFRDSDSTGARVLFLHGLYCASSAGIPLLDRMSEYCRVLAPDLPGYGRSGPFPGDAGVDEAAGGVWACVRKMGLEPVDMVVGYSMGGVVAARLLALHPGFSPRLALLGAPSMKRAFAPMVQALRPAIVGDTVALTASFGMRALAAVSGLVLSRANPWRIMLQGSVRSFGRVNARLVRSAFGVDITETARALENLQVLVLSGDRDRIVYPEHATNWTGLLPGAKLAWLPCQGHLAPFFTPGEASSRLQEFLFG